MDATGKYAPVPGNIPGTAMNLGGRDVVLPPLNLDGIQAAEPLLKSFAEVQTAGDVLRAGAQIVHLSLVRNYPDMTVDDVLGLLDMGNVNRAVLNVAGVSGMEFAKPGETRPAAQ